MADEKTLAGPSIVQVRGFFDQLLPGVFVLLHVWLVAYCVADENSRKEIGSVFQFPIAATLITLPAGYLLGLALRMIRTGLADRWSLKLLLLFPKGRSYLRLEWGDTSKSHGKFRRSKDEILKDVFPYPELMRIRISRQLPAEALEFFNSTWSQPNRPDRRLTVFTFDFWKVLLASVDPEAAREATSLEVAVRLAAHTCYALLMCICIMIPTTLLLFRSSRGHAELLELLTLVESVTLIVMIYNFRFFRTGEVERVFAFCFRHRVELKRLIEADDQPSASSAHA